MDRYWLLTSTFYGNWLPGDPRGFVSRVREKRPDDPPSDSRREHDGAHTPYDADLPGLHRYAAQELKGSPIRLNREQAEVLLQQFCETASHRGWQLLAVAIMSNHVHIVVGMDGDQEPTKVLGDLKAYGSRALNSRWGKPSNGTWWTYAGSKRKLGNEPAVLGAIEYVRVQRHALVVWLSEWALGERGRVSAPSD